MQFATLSIPTAAPVLAATRLRKGKAASAHGASRLIADAVATARHAWTVLAAIAFNLTRATGVLASVAHARARPGTIRDQLIRIPARIANRARRLHLHPPSHRP